MMSRDLNTSGLTGDFLAESEHTQLPHFSSVPFAALRVRDVAAPLTRAQRQVWQQAQRAPAVPFYNRVLNLERTGPVDLEALKKSLREIVRRHEALRTVFPLLDGTPVQVNNQLSAFELHVRDLGSLPRQQRRAEVSRAVTEGVEVAFNLANGPLWHGQLLRFATDCCNLVISVHPLVADEASLNVLARDLSVLYQAYSTGKAPRLPDLARQYTEYAHRQMTALQEDVFKKGISYWRRRLAGIPPVLELPMDRLRPPSRGFRGARQSLTLSKSLSESLKQLGDGEDVTSFLVVLAAFQTLLFRYTGQDDIVVGSIVEGRDGLGTEGLVGLFAQTCVTRTDLKGDPTFRELLGRVREAARSDYEHQNVPFDRLVSVLEPECDLGRHPIFQVLFSPAPSVSPLESSWRTATCEMDLCVAVVDLDVQLDDTPEGFVAEFTYDVDLFDSATIARMTGHFETLLQGIAANPDQRLSRLPLLAQAECRQILVEWNDTQSDYPRTQCIHQLFEAHADQTPDSTAVIFEDQRLTYGELNARANQLARYLTKRGVGPDVLIGICVERSLEMVVGLLGILKAGAAYVPLDPAYPRDRLSFMLDDAKVPVLLTQHRLVENLPKSGATILLLDTGWREIAKESSTNPASHAKPENLAYVIYTSGSTGKPKGVQIPHLAVVNFLISMARQPGIVQADRLLAVTTLSFDIAGLEIFLPLSVGASVEIASREVSSDGDRLLSKLASSGVTVMQATPATWRLMLEAGWQRSKDLKILCGGEAMSRELACELLNRSASVWNMYGPTETTIWSTTSRITTADGPITVGKPIANTETYVLDSHLEPVPVGVPGELYIGGDGLARGYLNRPDLTAEKFISNAFREPQSGARLYKTGDLVRYRPNGEIECLGRIDHQVKLRGFRIELGEIEFVLGQHPAVKQNVVVVREDVPGDKRLVAYLALRSGMSIALESLRDFLAQRLPDYMLPSRFIFLQALPLTPNGKVDRKNLPATDQLECNRSDEPLAPRNNVERQLLKIWRSVLNTDAIGVTDNFFFKHGGHSLLVAKLLRRVEQAFGKRFSMAAIFDAPTIEAQAAMLSDGTAVPRPSAVVPVQPVGSKPPFFCVGYHAGPVFLPLALHLGSDQPLLGIDPTLLQTSELDSPFEMESIAASLVKQIRAVQPQGPYFLGGFCGGGLTAYEVASQLATQGHHVGLLALFEPLTPIPEHARVFKFNLLRQKISFHFHNLRKLGVSGGLAYITDRAGVLFERVAKQASSMLSDMRSHRGWPRDGEAILDHALDVYRPRPFPGHVTLFLATNRPPGHEWECEYWRSLSKSMDVHEIPGYWNLVLRFFVEPSVEILANKLKDHLRRDRLRVGTDR